MQLEQGGGISRDGGVKPCLDVGVIIDDFHTFHDGESIGCFCEDEHHCCSGFGFGPQGHQFILKANGDNDAGINGCCQVLTVCVLVK